MKVSVTDTFGPALMKAIQTAGEKFERVQERNAHLVQAHIVKGIRQQRHKSGWLSLKPETVKRKALTGLSNLTLIGKGDLSSGFEVRKEGPGIYQVGTNEPYARAHEFGFEAGGIPERPYFRPALEEASPQLRENWKNTVKEVFGS